MLKNGEKWYDTEGNVIHAHGGHMLFFEGWYYWYGEDRRDDIYVSCYRSKDLKNWEFRNHVLKTSSPTEKTRVTANLSLKREDGGKVNIERPKVIYNKKTKRFVMWAHYENGLDYKAAAAAVASCDTPDGEFTYHGSFNPYGNMSRDCTLFTDGDKAYFASASRDNADLAVYLLADDYLNVARQINTLFQGEFREAPAFFKKDGKYFVISSWCTGWAPNQGTYAYSDSMDGLFTINEKFGDETTYRSQSAFVLPKETDGKTEYIYFGDRWGGRGEKYFESSYIVLKIEFDENGMPYINYSEDAYL